MTQLIIARYYENLDWIEQLTNLKDYIIYNKGSMDDVPYSCTELPQDNSRDSGTWLHHIINNYNNLYDCNIFLQGTPYKHNPGIIHYLNNFNTIPDNVEWLGIPKETIYNTGHSKNLPLLQICKHIFPDKQYDETSIFRFSNCAQYTVPLKFINNKSLEWWQYSQSVLKYYINQGSPWVFERLWPLIWDYQYKQ